MEPQSEGPWVSMAVLCQRVEPRSDGTVDVIGIVDGIVVEPESEDPLGLRPAARLSLTALVSVRAGSIRGQHILGLRSGYPSGPGGPGLERPVLFSDETPAASLVVPLEIEVHEPGAYTFDALYDGRLLTRMTLWVAYRH
jgi:hypothetical protein